MSAAIKILAPLLLLAQVTACRDNDPPDGNMLVSNGIPQDAEVEALPPDESSATPSDQLANGTASPIVEEDADAAPEADESR